jgi:hypothetical protein
VKSGRINCATTSLIGTTASVSRRIAISGSELDEEKMSGAGEDQRIKNVH